MCLFPKQEMETTKLPHHETGLRTMWRFVSQSARGRDGCLEKEVGGERSQHGSFLVLRPLNTAPPVVATPTINCFHCYVVTNFASCKVNS